MKRNLTNKERTVFDWIKSFQQDQGGYPTYREIQDALKFSSINSVTQYVKQLAKKGYLELIKNRGYRLDAGERPSLVSLPLMGAVQAGSANATQEVPEMVSLPQTMVASPQRSFLLKVRGNSMSQAGIHEDDLVIVEESKKANIGDVVVALLGEDTTVKRLSEKNGKKYLVAESKEHPDIYPEGEWEIQGVVKGLWRQF